MKSASLLLTLCLGFFLFTAYTPNSWNGWNCIDGEGKVVTQELKVGGFDQIGLSIPADVKIVPGDGFQVRVNAQQNLIDNIETKVSDGAWDIKFAKCVRKSEPISIHIVMPEIYAVAISGSGDVFVEEGFPAVKSMDLAVSGSGSLNCSFEAKTTDVAISGSGDVSAKLITQSLDAAISGSGDLELEGAAEELSVSIAGSGDVNAFDLLTKNTEVSIAGSGDVEVSVDSALDASIVGSGSVYYKGSPEVDRSIMGSGSIRKQ